MQSKEFLELPGDQVCKLITRDSLDIEEEDLYNSALNWINHDLPRRKTLILTLMEHIRFPVMSHDFLTMVVANESLIATAFSVINSW